MADLFAVNNLCDRPFFPPDDAAVYLKDDLVVLESGQPRIGIFEPYQIENQACRYLRTDKIPLPGPSGKLDRLVAIATDVTEIETAHAASQQAQERLSMAMKAANIGLWDWNVPTGETHFSDTYYTMLGYEPGELPMELETWRALVHPDDLQGALAAVKRHIDGETPFYTSEHRLRCKDGRWLWNRASGEIIAREADGSPRRFIGVHVEIQALRDALERANEANRTKSDFLANMSHEIRTPMTAILGYADLLGEYCDLPGNPEHSAEAIQIIRGNADHLLTIINDILDVSKIEAGQLAIEMLSVSPVAILRDVVTLIGPRAQEQCLQLKVVCESALPKRIRTDPTRLRQILVNLTGNAVKFTKTGDVTVEVLCDPDREQMTFRIKDTGIGMSADQLERIRRFEPFTQADTSTARKFGGTGLGLRICNTLTELLGGDLSVTSAEGEGSTFTATIGTGPIDAATMYKPKDDLTWPIAMMASPERVVIDAAKAKPLDGVRVLLAEDNPVNQKLIGHILSKAGAIVSVCENGRIAVEAVESAAGASPQVVLMDVQMPELDGLSATRRIREGGVTLPIVALTANAMESDRRQCLEAGCDDFLSKPVDRRRLIETCSKWARSADLSS